MIHKAFFKFCFSFLITGVFYTKTEQNYRWLNFREYLPFWLHLKNKVANHCPEVHFASFFSGGFTTMAVINPPERKLIKCTSALHCPEHFSPRENMLRTELIELSPFSRAGVKVKYFLISSHLEINAE